MQNCKTSARTAEQQGTKSRLLFRPAAIAAILLLAAVVSGCEVGIAEEAPIKRNYNVRLSNSVGSDWYQCDSIIIISKTRFQLKNNEDSIYFIDIDIPQNVVVRVYPNSL